MGPPTLINPDHWRDLILETILQFMPRPAAYSDPQLLAAAIALAAEGGPAAVTMVGVAKQVGAPSGSVYHRFQSRPVLLARVWLAALQAFEQAWWPAAEASHDPGEVALIPYTWAQEEPRLARLLAAHHRHDFVAAGTASTADILAHEARLADRLGILSERFLGDREPASLERTRFALATVPLAAIRDRWRHPHADPHADPRALVAEAARALLEAP